MALSVEMLGQPAERVARLQALSLLDAVVETRVRLGRSDDAEALHDFRVALRRLRSWLRAYDDLVSESVRRRLRRQLRRLAQATGESRDLEVHLAWLDAQRPALTRREQVGVDALKADLAARRRLADTRLEETVSERFATLAQRLRRRLGRYTVTIELDAEAAPHTFADVAAQVILLHTDELERRLAAVRSASDETEAHKGRIAAKRLRYVLEPLRDPMPQVGSLVDSLKDLQDSLGDLHDAHVFSAQVMQLITESANDLARHETETALDRAAGRSPRSRWHDPRPGLIAVGRMLRERGDAAFASVSPVWFDDHAAPFLASVRAVAAELAAFSTTPLEIERKYLLDAVPSQALHAEWQEIDQGWIAGDTVAERLRRVRDANGERWYRTVKLGTGVARAEFEEEVSGELFAALWPVTEGRRVHKQRYRIADGDQVWEVDRFLDRPLVLAEVELADAAQTPELPTWLAPHVVQDVTGDPDFVNRHLAR